MTFMSSDEELQSYMMNQTALCAPVHGGGDGLGN